MSAHERLPAAEADANREALVAMHLADPDNWREDEHGRYYVGPTIAGDGTIDWPEPTP